MVNEFNLKRKDGNATNFMMNVLNTTTYPLNMSLTEAPQFDPIQGLIGLHFDGLFYDSPLNTSHVTPNKAFPPVYANAQSE
jgi:hypothetical protein